MDSTEAGGALGALEPLLSELERILRQQAQSDDVAASRDRFARWKARAVAAIAHGVSAEEAQRFEQTYVPLIMGQGEYNALVDEIGRFEASLRVLIEEIRERPDLSLLTTARPALCEKG